MSRCSRLRRTLSLLALGALAGCSALSGGARIDGPAAPPAGRFQGLIGGPEGSAAADPARPRTIYVFQTHGMNSPCATKWINELFSPLTRRGWRHQDNLSTGWSAVPLQKPVTFHGQGEQPAPAHGYQPAPPAGCDDAGEPLVVPPHPPPWVFDTFGQYRLDVFTKADGRSLRVYSYHWRGDLWQVTGAYIGADLAADTWNVGYHFPSTTRSPINAALKRNLMDEGFTDAVGYLTPVGEVARDGAEQVICQMLVDAIAAKDPTRRRSCAPGGTPPQPQDMGKIARDEFDFLSHSLGSRLLFDVLTREHERNGDATRLDRTVRIALARRTALFFMAANQLPLLAPDSLRPALPDVVVLPMPQAFAQFRTSQSEAATIDLLPLTIVAFHDPDDFLGFKASDADLAAPPEAATTVLDVYHRNTPQWAFSFAASWKAHDNELNEPQSQQIILCGALAAADGTLKAGACR